jgi:hypothetical protein
LAVVKKAWDSRSLQIRRISLKLLTALPEPKHYKRIESPTPGRFLWEDKASPAIRIMADFSNPFSRQLVIVISQQKMKTDLSEYPYRVVFRCFEAGDNAIPAVIVREQFKGVYAWSQAHPNYGYPLFFGVPIAEKSWLGYSIYLCGSINGS